MKDQGVESSLRVFVSGLLRLLTASWWTFRLMGLRSREVGRCGTRLHCWDSCCGHWCQGEGQWSGFYWSPGGCCARAIGLISAAEWHSDFPLINWLLGLRALSAAGRQTERSPLRPGSGRKAWSAWVTSSGPLLSLQDESSQRLIRCWMWLRFVLSESLIGRSFFELILCESSVD